MLRRALIILLLVAFAPEAWAQFSEPAQTIVRWRLTGEVLSEGNAPAPQAGDQVVAVFNGEVIGLFRFTSGQSRPREFTMIVYGNDPTTPEKDGPDFNDQIFFRFFESSTGQERADIVAVNFNGATRVVRYQGADLSEFLDFPLPLDFVTPAEDIILVLGREGDSGDGDTGPSFDVNGDGVIDKRDAAMVLRIITGNTRGLAQNQIRRADVNRDGVVDTRDVVAIMRAIHGFSLPASRRSEITGR